MSSSNRTVPRLLLPIACVAMLPALGGCSGEPAPPPPLTPDALAAVTDTPGAPPEQLAREVDDLFSGVYGTQDLGETRALVIMHAGEIAAERYAPGYDADTRHVSWSMAKTVTAVMIGMLVADGRLRLDESPPVPRWQRPGDPRGEITLRQLLQMRSGLRHTEAGAIPYESAEVRMLFLDGRDDMADWATAQPLEAEPGATFEYSSNTTVILADIAARDLDGGERGFRTAPPGGARISAIAFVRTAGHGIRGRGIRRVRHADRRQPDPCHCARLGEIRRISAQWRFRCGRTDRAASMDRLHGQPQPAFRILWRADLAQPRIRVSIGTNCYRIAGRKRCSRRSGIWGNM